MDSGKSTDNPFKGAITNVSTLDVNTQSSKSHIIAKRAGWRLLEPGEGGLPKPSNSLYRIAQCDGMYGQHHYGIIRDLTASCAICRTLHMTQERECVQHVYVEGRTTFEFICVRGHHYLASSHKKSSGRCKMCVIEDECKQLGRTIKFDGKCTYITADSLLRYYCVSCASEHYITYNKWNSLFSVTKVRTTYKSVIDWCMNGKHNTPDSAFNSIIMCMSIFEQLFDARFDDSDDMIAANNKILSGIYFTGYNRKLRIAFQHVLDPHYRKDNKPLVDWCESRGIMLITIATTSKSDYGIMLSDICAAVVDADLKTRFGNYIKESPPDIDRTFHRKKELIACILAEGRIPLRLRMNVK
jgi:hypothetical protein